MAFTTPILLLLLLTAQYAAAQSPPDNNNNNRYFGNNFNPSMAIIIVVLISAFFFLGFFSVYIRQCAEDRRDPSSRAAATATARSRRQRGVDPELLASFPTLVYSDVKAHKIGKSSLECAVCLSEFEEDETLRLLPQCSHVFHPDCIDAWLSAHVTCPVCRTNLTDPVPPPKQQIQEPDPTPPAPAATEQTEQVVIELGVDDRETATAAAEMSKLENFVNMKRAKSRARPARFPRSHSTGHSLVLPGENLDRFTLRLPENIRREIVSQAERLRLQRTKSCVVAFPGEGSSRKGYRGGEGSSRGTRSIRLGRSDRWGSSLLRTLSMKVPNWGRRGGGGDEGSVSMKGGGGLKGGDGSMRRSINAVISPFDCYGGGGAVKNDDFQSSTAALNRV